MAAMEPLTSAQRERLDRWARQWTGTMPSTKPADFDRAEAAALRCYKLLGLPPPLVVLRMPSPRAALQGAATAWSLLRERPELEAWLPDGANSNSVWIGRSDVADEMMRRLEEQCGLFLEQAGLSWPELRTKLIRPELLGVDSDIIVAARFGDVYVDSQVWTQLTAQLPAIRWGGHHLPFRERMRLAAHWRSHGVERRPDQIAVAAFLRTRPGLVHPRLDLLACHGELIAACGGVWLHDSILAISDRPCLINLDEEARLHSATGPSVTFPDGESCWHLHGTQVPGMLVERPHEISVAMIDSEQNVEVRRLMLERYRADEEVHGVAAYMRDGGAVCIDDDMRYGKLWMRPLSGVGWLFMLEVVNATPEPDGTFKHYWLGVPPDMRTAREAVAWTFDVAPEEYAPVVET